MLELNLDRKNTYSNSEYFKVVVLTKNEETSIEQSRWLTNNYKKLHRTDVIRCEYKKTSLVCYPRYKDQSLEYQVLAIEGLFIYVEDEESWNSIKEIYESTYKGVFSKALVSSHDKAEEWARSIGAQRIAFPNRMAVIETLDHLDMDEYELIFNKFSEFDEDRSGSISTSEMTKIAKFLGEDPEGENLKAAMLAFDTNQDGKINFAEFLSWWKIGRKDLITFTKFYALHQYVITKLDEIFDKTKLEEVLKNERLKDSSKSLKSDVNIDTKNIEEYITRIYLRAAIGESARKEACKNYLSRYNDKMEFNSDYFIDIAVFTKSCTIDGQSSVDYIKHFQKEIIEKIDSTIIPGFKQFMDKFLIIRVYPSDFSVNLRFEFKYDVQELLKTALNGYTTITDWLTNLGKNPFDFDFKYHSGKCFGDILEDGAQLCEVVESCELKLKFSAVKDKIKALISSLLPEYQESTKYLKPFYIPSSLKIKYEGRLDQMLDSKSKELLNKDLLFLNKVVDFLKENIPEDLRKSMSRLEAGINIVDSFYSVQVFSEHLWH